MSFFHGSYASFSDVIWSQWLLPIHWGGGIAIIQLGFQVQWRHLKPINFLSNLDWRSHLPGGSANKGTLNDIELVAKALTGHSMTSLATNELGFYRLLKTSRRTEKKPSWKREREEDRFLEPWLGFGKQWRRSAPMSAPISRTRALREAKCQPRRHFRVSRRVPRRQRDHRRPVRRQHRSEQGAPSTRLISHGSTSHTR